MEGNLSLALVGRAVLSKTWILLCAAGWGWAPSLLVVWPEVDPILESTGSVVGLIATFKRTYIETHLPGMLLLEPRALSGHCQPTLCRRPSSTHKEVWLSLPWGPCSSPLGPGAHRVLFVPSKGRASSSPSPVEVLSSNPVGLQRQFLWGFPVPLPDPRARSQMGA